MQIYGKIIQLTPNLSLGVGYPRKCFIVVRCVHIGTSGMLEGIGSDVTGVVPYVENLCFHHDDLLTCEDSATLWRMYGTAVFHSVSVWKSGSIWDGLYPFSVSRS